MAQIEGQAIVTRANLFSVQVCVPKGYSDTKVVECAEELNPCGTERGWMIRRDAPERAQCERFSSHEHITLDA